MRVRAIMAALFTLLLPSAASAGTVTTVYTVPTYFDGADPDSPLTQLGTKYYGTTSVGGTSELGTIFSLDVSTGKEATLYSFLGAGMGAQPLGGLVVIGSKLYGVENSSGRYTPGQVFEFDPTSGQFAVDATLSATIGQYAQIAVLDGKIYGTGTSCGDPKSSGCIFSFDPSNNASQIVYSFDDRFTEGADPTSLVAVGNVLYGTTLDGGRGKEGCVFRFDPTTSEETVVYSFKGGGDGATPLAGMLDVGGVLYGTTEFGGAFGYGGGAFGYGSVFSFDPGSGKETILFSFNSADGSYPTSPLTVYNGFLYGTTGAGNAPGTAVIFSIDLATGSEATLHTLLPGEGLTGNGFVEDGGLLYETTGFSGGAGESGTIIAVNPTTGAVTTLHHFASYNNAGSALIPVKGSLYGTAANGGTFGLGSIFRYNPSDGTGEDLFSFNGTDGGQPQAALLSVGGLFYGVTSTGTASNAGTVFSFDPKTQTLATLYTFTGGDDGGVPMAALVETGGALFGTKSLGGKHGYGTVFKLDLSSFKETTLHDQSKFASSIVLGDGALYIETNRGGDDNDGAIIKIDPATGIETTVFSFNLTDGAVPADGLLFSGGLLYGLELAGPSVFSVDPSTGTEKIIASLESNELDLTSLIKDGDNLFGVVETGYGAKPSIYRVDISTGKAKTLYTSVTDALFFDTALVRARGGYYGGAGRVIYRFNR